MLRRFVSLVALCLLGCSETPSLPDIEVRVVDAVGGSPLAGREIATVRVLQREANGEPVETISTVADGTFDLSLALADFEQPSELRFELRSLTGTELTGSTPIFYPGEGATGGLRIVVGAPGTCDVVTASQLPVERRAFGAVALGTFALVIAGIEQGGPSERIGWHDLLLHTPGAVTFDLPNTPGRSRAAAASRTHALVISEGDGPFLYNLYARSAPRTELTLHPGASRASAVLAAGDGGAIAIGGLDDGNQPVVGVSYVTADAKIASGTLSTPFFNRVAAYAADGVYVLSRGAGNATLERVVRGMDDAGEPTVTATVLIPALADGVRVGATLFFTADGTQGLLIGGSDQNGMPRTDTVYFSGCPSACVTAPGPTWTTARLSPMTEPSGYLVGGEGPSALVDRVTFGASGPVITALGPLENARFDGGVLAHPSGTLIVLGGMGTSGIRRDVEMCFPVAID
jgi:hypothetical protein